MNFAWAILHYRQYFYIFSSSNWYPTYRDTYLFFGLTNCHLLFKIKLKHILINNFLFVSEPGDADRGWPGDLSRPVQQGQGDAGQDSQSQGPGE